MKGNFGPLNIESQLDPRLLLLGLVKNNEDMHMKCQIASNYTISHPQIQYLQVEQTFLTILDT